MCYSTNIKHVLEQCTKKDFELGAQWYTKAREIAITLHPDFLIGAGVLAALSARCEWTENVRRAQHFFATGEVIHTGTIAKKVFAIACMADPTVECILYVLNGLKLKNFFLNIIGSTENVTVDSHAAHLAGLPLGKAVTNKRYREIAKAYASFANENYSPSQIQAITWIRYKASHGRQKSKAYLMTK